MAGPCVGYGVPIGVPVAAPGAGVCDHAKAIIERPTEVLRLRIASIVLYVFFPETGMSRNYIAIADYSVPSVRLRTAFTKTG